MGTIVYIDGFNFYYGAVKGTPHKWLDLEALARRLLPRDEIIKVRYFTARISSRPDDPQQAVRQETYLRALSTLPLVEMHFGHYVTRTTRMPLATPPDRGARTVEVLKTEEKGSDVNLATYLLLDAFRGNCDTAVVVSNDSDLADARPSCPGGGRSPGRDHQSASGEVSVSTPPGDLLQAAASERSGPVSTANDDPRRRRCDHQAADLVKKRRGPPKRAPHPATEATGGIPLR